MASEPRILDAIQDRSGLRVLVEFPWALGPPRLWVRPPEAGITVEEAERLIEAQGVKVQGRMS